MELFKAISRLFRKRPCTLRTGDCVQFIGRELKQKNPEYYPEMYQDGFTPEEIMYAFRKQMRRQAEDERPVKINFSSEVKIKR